MKSLLGCILCVALPMTSAWAQFQVDWQKNLDHDGQAIAIDVAVLENGEGVIGGNVYPEFDAPSDIFLDQFDAQGNVIGSRRYELPGTQMLNDIWVCPDGFVLAGWTLDPTSGARDALVIRTNTQGELLWHKRYGGAFRDEARSVCASSDGGFVFCGQTQSSEGDEGDLYVVKIDGNGEVQWEKNYGGGYPDWGSGIRPTRQGGFIVAGSQGTASLNMQLWALCLNESGEQLWTKNLGGQDYECGQQVVQTSDGSFFLIGSGSTLYQNLMDVYAIKLGETGNLIWQRRWGEGTYYDYGVSCDVNENGDVVVLGMTKERATEQYRGMLLTVSSNGQLQSQWLKDVAVSGWYHAMAQSGNDVLCCGQLYEAAEGFKAQLLRLKAQTTSVPSDVRRVEGVGPLGANYPNPFRQTTTVPLTLLSGCEVELSVLDLQGRVVEKLLHDQCPPGEKKVTIDGSAWPSGSYWLQLKAGVPYHRSWTRKMILVH